MFTALGIEHLPEGPVIEAPGADGQPLPPPPPPPSSPPDTAPPAEYGPSAESRPPPVGPAPAPPVEPAQPDLGADLPIDSAPFVHVHATIDFSPEEISPHLLQFPDPHTGL